MVAPICEEPVTLGYSWVGADLSSPGTLSRSKAALGDPTAHDTGLPWPFGVGGPHKTEIKNK